MKTKVKLSPINPNVVETSDNEFKEHGDWERKNGPYTTRRFAECFVENIKIPLRSNFAFLDFGCALGQGLRVIQKNYPNARLYGCDFSKVAIERCKKLHSSVAEFFVSSFDDFDREFDVIYCSNVLEHIENHVEIVRELITYCKILYVMTPYMEHINGKPITLDMGYYHVATLDEHTFDSILADKNIKLSTKTFTCWRVWGNSWKKKVKKLLFCIPYDKRAQICYEFINLKKWVAH
jgi:SAM-dependent methyltransferase